MAWILLNFVLTSIHPVLLRSLHQNVPVSSGKFLFFSRQKRVSATHFLTEIFLRKISSGAGGNTFNLNVCTAYIVISCHFFAKYIKPISTRLYENFRWKNTYPVDTFRQNRFAEKFYQNFRFPAEMYVMENYQSGKLETLL